MPHEIVVVDDASSDATWKKVTELAANLPQLHGFQNPSQPGFGTAVVHGLDVMKGDAIVTHINLSAIRAFLQEALRVRTLLSIHLNSSAAKIYVGCENS